MGNLSAEVIDGKLDSVAQHHHSLYRPYDLVTFIDDPTLNADLVELHANVL